MLGDATRDMMLRECLRHDCSFYAALGTPLLAQQPEDPPFALPDGVNLQRDIVYARYGSRELKLISLPPQIANWTGRRCRVHSRRSER